MVTTASNSDNHANDLDAAVRDTVGGTEKLLKYTDFEKVIAALNIDEESRASARRLWALIEPHTDAIFEKFYRNWLAIDITDLYQFRENEIATLKQKQRRHWEELFSGRLDVDYIIKALHVGVVHRDKQITIQYYSIGYFIIKSEMMAILKSLEPSSFERERFFATLEKFVALDLALTMIGYSAASF